MTTYTKIVGSMLIVSTLSACGGGGSGGGGSGGGSEEFDKLTPEKLANLMNEDNPDIVSATDIDKVHEDSFDDDSPISIGSVLVGRDFGDNILFGLDFKGDTDELPDDVTATLYIDTDNNASTGKSINDIGADIRIADTGSNNPQDEPAAEWNETTDTWDELTGPACCSREFGNSVDGGFHVGIQTLGTSVIDLSSSMRSTLRLEQLTSDGGNTANVIASTSSFSLESNGDGTAEDIDTALSSIPETSGASDIVDDVLESSTTAFDNRDWVDPPADVFGHSRDWRLWNNGNDILQDPNDYNFECPLGGSEEYRTNSSVRASSLREGAKVDIRLTDCGYSNYGDIEGDYIYNGKLSIEVIDADMSDTVIKYSYDQFKTTFESDTEDWELTLDGDLNITAQDRDAWSGDPESDFVPYIKYDNSDLLIVFSNNKSASDSTFGLSGIDSNVLDFSGGSRSGDPLNTLELKNDYRSGIVGGEVAVETPSTLDRGSGSFFSEGILKITAGDDSELTADFSGCGSGEYQLEVRDEAASLKYDSCQDQPDLRSLESS